MMVSGTMVGEAGGERALHLGDTFAVLPSMLPSTANYVALGHVHRPQAVANAPVAGGSFYAGSLLQLDFGEAEQKKSVRLVEGHPGTPAESRAIPITGGKMLRNLRVALQDLEQHAGEYPDDYLRVIVDVRASCRSSPNAYSKCCRTRSRLSPRIKTRPRPPRTRRRATDWSRTNCSPATTGDARRGHSRRPPLTVQSVVRGGPTCDRVSSR